MNSIITDNISKIHSLCKKYKVKELYAFGSVTGEKFKTKSDVDLLVEFSEIKENEYADNYFYLHESLKMIFERDVDLVTYKFLRNPVFIRVVDRTKIPIYAS